MSKNNRTGGSMPKPPEANNEVSQSPADGEPVTQVQTGAPPAHSSVKVKEQKSGIMVTALQKGFYLGLRRNSCDRFLISGKKAWGTWMECDDKKLQAELVKQRKENIKQIRQD